MPLGDLRQEATSTANGDAAMTKPPQANPMMEGLSPGSYVLRALKRVKAAELEQALLMLPFSDALNLLAYLPSWLAHGSQVDYLCLSRVEAVMVESICKALS